MDNENSNSEVRRRHWFHWFFLFVCLFFIEGGGGVFFFSFFVISIFQTSTKRYINFINNFDLHCRWLVNTFRYNSFIFCYYILVSSSCVWFFCFIFKLLFVEITFCWNYFLFKLLFVHVGWGDKTTIRYWFYFVVFLTRTPYTRTWRKAGHIIRNDFGQGDVNLVSSHYDFIWFFLSNYSKFNTKIKYFGVAFLCILHES